MNKKRLNWLILACVLLLSIPAVAYQDKKPLINEDVIKMTKAGLPESTIVLTIQKSSNKFDTSPDALIALKEAGVTQKVLDAILQMSSTTVPPPGLNIGALTKEPIQPRTTFQGNNLLGTWECFQVSDEYQSGSGKIPRSLKPELLVRYFNNGVTQDAWPDDRLFTSPKSTLNWKYTVQSNKSGVIELIYLRLIAARLQVKWIDVNTYEDEILYSNEPAYIGIKRVFRRIYN